MKENSIIAKLSWKLTYAVVWVLFAANVAFVLYHIVEYWHETDELIADLGEFGVLFFFNLLALPVMLYLARYHIRKELHPLEHAVATAASIQKGQLTERIEVENPPEEIMQLALAFNAAFDRYHSLLEKAQQFNADASHQLRTPLAVMRTTGDVALSQSRSESEYREVIGSMLEETQHLQKIVTQLLELAKISNESLALEPVAVGPLFQRVMDRFSPVIEDFPDRVSVHCDEDITVLGNEVLLVEALSNLMDNALTHTPANKGIFLEVTKDDDDVMLQVRDLGDGIPQENIERLSDRFYQCTSGSGKGSGLGLAIVKAIAELHGAALSITSSQGEGTCVGLSFSKNRSL